MQRRILVACEYSGIVRDAFKSQGWNAWSCDILPTEWPGQHYQCDVREVLHDKWDMMIAHPPCTYLCVSGALYHKKRKYEQQDALSFVSLLMFCNIPRICIENPISIISTNFRKPDQIIQPWMFGHGETKATCLWLKGLPKLKPTNILSGRESNILKLRNHPERQKARSRTYIGIARAMAIQWTAFLNRSK